MAIRLRAVTADNFDVISELPLLPQQRDYLASNDYSIAQTSFYPATMHARAVYCENEVIGFLMFVSPGRGKHGARHQAVTPEPAQGQDQRCGQGAGIDGRVRADRRTASRVRDGRQECAGYAKLPEPQPQGPP